MLGLYLCAFVMILVLYDIYLVPYWSYRGFIAEPSNEKIAIAIGIISLFVLATPSKVDVRSFFLNFALSIHLLPLMAVYAYSGKPTEHALVICLAFAIVYLVSSVNIPRISAFKIGSSVLLAILMSMPVLFILALYFLGGFRYFNLDIASVYEFRKDASDNLPGIFGYFSSIVTKIIIPVAVCISLVKRNYMALLLLIFISVIIFGLTAHKGVLFSPFLVIAVYYAVFYFRYNYFIIFGLIAGLAIGIIVSFLADLDAPGTAGVLYNTLIIRRVLMVPAVLSHYYLDFFSYNPQYYWSSSSFSFGITDNPYGVPPPILIGEVFFDGDDTSANTGFIGSGFAQAGLWGVTLYSFGAGLLIAIFNTYGRFLGLPFIVAVMIRPMQTMLLSTDFPTLFLTHGMLLLLLLMPLLPAPGSERGARRRKQSLPEMGSLKA